MRKLNSLSKHFRTELAPNDSLAKLAQDAGVPFDLPMTQAIAWYDRASGTLQRLKLAYGIGETAEMRFGKRGQLTSVNFNIKMVFSIGGDSA